MVGCQSSVPLTENIKEPDRSYETPRGQPTVRTELRLLIRHQPAWAARSRVSRCRISADVQKVSRESGGPLRRKAVGNYAVPLPALNSLDKPFDSGTHLVHERPSEDQSARVPEKLPLIDANQYRLGCVRDAPIK